jgi:AsmA protein
MRVQGDIPDLWRATDSAQFAAQLFLPASQILDLARIASNRIASELAVSGNLDAALDCCGASRQPSATIGLDALTLTLGGLKPIVHEDATAHLAAGELTLAPVALNLGAPQPAMQEAHATHSGYTLHLTGSALRSRLLALGAALPQFGDGLEAALPPVPEVPATPEAPIRVDLTSTRTWQGAQSWTAAPVRPARPGRHRR